MEITYTGPLRRNFHHHTDCVQDPPAQELLTVKCLFLVFFTMQCEMLHGLANHSVDIGALLEWNILVKHVLCLQYVFEDSSTILHPHSVGLGGKY